MVSRRALQRGITVSLTLANLCLLVAYTGAWVNSSPQNGKKTVVRPRTLVKEPVEITFEHRGKPVRENEEFEGDSNWVKELKFKVKNKSDKTITYVLLDVDFPGTAAAAGRVAQQQIILGQGPEDQTARRPLQLRPGESAEVSLDVGYDEIRNLIGRTPPVDSISKAVIRLHQVMFDDGTLFSSGSTYRRNTDPHDPHKWVEIEN